MFAFQLVGVGVISVGAWTYSDKAFMEVLLRNNLFMSATYIMMGTGCAAIILAVIGWVGAFKVLLLLASLPYSNVYH